MMSKSLSRIDTAVGLILSCLVYAQLSHIHYAYAADGPSNTYYDKCSAENLDWLSIHGSFEGKKCLVSSSTPATGNIFEGDLFRPGCGNDPGCKVSVKYDTVCQGKVHEKLLKSCFPDQSLDQAKECKEDITELNTKYSEFNTACGKSYGGGGSGCFAGINQCLACQGYDTSNEICASLETTSAVDDISIGSLQGFFDNPGRRLTPEKGTFAPNSSKAKQRYANCPQLAKEGLDEWRDRAEDARDKMNDVMQKKNNLQTRKDQETSRFEEALENIDNQIEETAEKGAEAERELEKTLGQIDNEVRQEVSRLQDQRDQTENLMAEARSAYERAYEVYLQALTALDQQCHAAALQSINALQAQIQLAKQNKSYTAGMQKDLLGRSGESERVAFQRKAKEFFDRCKRDPSYNSAAQSAQRALANAERTLDRALDSLRQQRENISDKIEDLVNRTRNDMKLQAVKDATLAVEKLQKSIEKLTKSRTRLIQAFQRDVRSIDREMAQVELELATARQRLTEVEAYTKVKIDASGGVSAESGSSEDAMAKYSDVIGAASSVKSTCGCDAGTMHDRSGCTRACEVLYMSGDGGDDYYRYSDGTSGSLSDDGRPIEAIISICNNLGTSGSTENREPTGNPTDRTY